MSNTLGAFSAMDIAASGLSAERVRMNTIASNLANAKTTRTAEGGAFRRMDPVFRAEALQGDGPSNLSGVSKVSVGRIVRDPRQGTLVHDPQHPDANAQGYVEYPNVDVVEEMVNMITASRAYEAGVSSIESIKGMASAAIKIGG
jgi:flagellar basal-body rod protein FlgC